MVARPAAVASALVRRLAATEHQHQDHHLQVQVEVIIGTIGTVRRTAKTGLALSQRWTERWTEIFPRF